MTESHLEASSFPDPPSTWWKTCWPWCSLSDANTLGISNIKEKRSGSYIAILTQNRNSTLYNLGSGSWLAREKSANAAIRCPR